MTLHWQQTRRARGLAMPLPPTPKRPLGPPVLFNWAGVDIRTRADIEAAGHAWDEFLDSVAGIDDLRQFGMIFEVLQLVPDEERRALNLEIRRRRHDRLEREAARDRARDVDRIVETPWFKCLRRRA